MKKTCIHTLTAFMTFCLFFLGHTAFADMQVPSLPPTEQVQHPSAEVAVPGSSTPVNIQVQTDRNTQPEENQTIEQVKNEIESILADILKSSATVVVVAKTAQPAQTVPKGYAKNMVTAPVQPAKRVEAVILRPAPKSLFGKSHVPVRLFVKDGQGKELAKKDFKYHQNKDKELTNEIKSFLSKYIPLTSSQTPATGTVKAPGLRSWIESSHGKDIMIGSQVAIYYTTDTNGYISLYHFGSSGNVQRIYPNKAEKINFIQSGKIYRFPASGWITMNGPAGQETIKLVLTTLPSNTPITQEGGLSFKTKPLNIIPTHYPVLFSDGDMTRFFALPGHLYTENHITYSLLPPK